MGGYNRLVKGWVQVSSTKAPGMKLTSSSYGGTQQELAIIVQQNSVGDWWVSVNGEWMGYYPTSLFSSTKGIKDNAKGINWYGEVYDSSAPAATTTDMGSVPGPGRWCDEEALWVHLVQEAAREASRLEVMRVEPQVRIVPAGDDLGS